MTQSTFKNALTASIQRRLRESPQPRLGIAVSGGLDSMLLLEAVRRAVADGHPWEVVVLHVDHGLRRRSRQDAQTVIAAASEAGFPCRVVEPGGAPPPSGGSSMERWARDARYRALARLGRECDLEAVLTGQHRDDQAETLAWKLARGHAVMGLAPMPEARRLVTGHPLMLLRPFLPFPRSALMAQARAWDVSWRPDESNGDLRHRRNLLRHVLIPLAARGETEALLARLANLGATAATLRDRALHLAGHLVDSLGSTDFEPEGRTIAAARFPLAALRELPFEVAHAVLSLLVRAVSAQTSRVLPPAVTEAVLAGETVAGGPREVRPGLSLRWEGGADIIVESRERVAPPGCEDWPPRRIGIPSTLIVPSWPWAVRARLEDGRSQPRVTSPSCQDLPHRAARGALRLRRWVPGERIRPFGMEGRKRVVDLLREAGIPAWRRASYPVVADDRGILWIPGVRADERCRITAVRGPILSLEMVSAREAGERDREGLATFSIPD